MARAAQFHRSRRDGGFSLVETVITIVLLGIGVTAVLIALRTSTKASAIDEEHAVAFSWLQAASDEIFRADRLACDTNTRADIIDRYDDEAKDAPRPVAWASDPDAVIAVTNVQFLGKPDPDSPYEWGDAYCLEGGAYADAPQYTQRVTITATTPRGIVKTLQMVKGQS